MFDGYRIRVEFPRSSSKGGGFNRRDGGGRFRSFNRDSRPKGYQLMVSGLPSTGSWQDVKVKTFISCTDQFMRHMWGDILWTSITNQLQNYASSLFSHCTVGSFQTGWWCDVCWCLSWRYRSNWVYQIWAHEESFAGLGLQQVQVPWGELTLPPLQLLAIVSSTNRVKHLTYVSKNHAQTPGPDQDHTRGHLVEVLSMVAHVLLHQGAVLVIVEVIVTHHWVDTQDLAVALYSTCAVLVLVWTS